MTRRVRNEERAELVGKRPATVGMPRSVVDESAPKTNIQIRFHNGERASITVNLTHTVADIHAYVTCAAPCDNGYTLVSGFPPKPLNDASKTIEQAGLKSASLTQKIS